MTAEQLEAARAERMRQNGHGALTIEDARTWIEETGLCLFLPRRQFSASIAPSFVEAIAGRRDATPGHEHIALAEELLVRLETDGVAVRLNLLGLPGEQPDFVVASWVLPYVYALRGDRDWRRSPQLTGSRQVSPLAVQAYKLLETADTNIADLTRDLGREVTEVAVLRAITELWQQLRIIPVIAAPGQPAKWQLLRHRFQKAIAEGASTSQVTAISVLASIYLQAVIAATMEDVEIFLSSLTARSKVREVLRGLMATRQVHTVSLGHSPLFYVAGTLPEFAVAASLYANSALSASSFFTRSHEEGVVEFLGSEETLPAIAAESVPVAEKAVSVEQTADVAPPEPTEEVSASRPETVRPAVRLSAPVGKTAASRPHFSRPAANTRDRKPTPPSNGRTARRVSSDSRPASSGRSNGTQTGAASASGTGNPARPASGASAARTGKPSPSAWGQRSSRPNGAKASGPASSQRNGSSSPNGNNRRPALAAGAKSGNSKPFGFVARPNQEKKSQG